MSVPHSSAVSAPYQSALSIDVSKKLLEVASSKPLQIKRVPNTADGIERLIAEIQQVQPDIIVIEATGGYQNAVVAALHQAGFPVHVAQPSRVRYYAKAMGVLAKTDKVDAAIMVRFALSMQPEPTPQPEEEAEQVHHLQTRHQQLNEMLVAEKNRCQQAPPSTKAGIEQHIAWLNQQISDLEQQLAAKIKNSQKLNAMATIAQSIPGVGPGTTATLLGALPELGQISHKKIAALVGVAPYAYESGPFTGKRMIHGGRAAVRTALYMATIASLRWNDQIKCYYQDLLARGKKKKVAIIACVRKLLTVLNAMIRDNKTWCPNLVGQQNSGS